jgi:N utilization substance protein B
MLRPETRSRARAFQLLYAWETQGRPPFEDIVPGVAHLVRPSPTELDAALVLAEAAIARHHELDEIVARASEHWRHDRMGLAERLILRLGAAELVQDLAPPKVVIDEALWLTRRFASPAAVPFINGILDRVARDLGRL